VVTRLVESAGTLAAELGALAEHTRGVARGVSNVVFVVGDVGVDGGVISGGAVELRRSAAQCARDRVQSSNRAVADHMS
jgi:hypothetical protein